MRLGRRENERGEEMRPAIRASRPKFIHTTAHYPLKRERDGQEAYEMSTRQLSQDHKKNIDSALLLEII